MKKSIAKKVILLVFSAFLAILVLWVVNNIVTNSKDNDEIILQNQHQHILLIKTLKSRLNKLSNSTYKLSKLDEKRLFNTYKYEIEYNLTEINKIIYTLIQGGTYKHRINVNLNNLNSYDEILKFIPAADEKQSELIELKPRIEYLQQISEELVKDAEYYYSSTPNNDIIKEVQSLYKQQESIINRSKENANRAFVSANKKKIQLKKEMKKQMTFYNYLRSFILGILIVIFLFFLRKAILQINQIIDKHEISTKELEENNKTIQKLLDSLPVGIALANRKQEIKHINNTALNWMKEAAETEYIGKHCRQVFCLDDEENCPITSDNLIIHDIELKLKQADGSRKSIMKSAIPLRLQNEDMILEAFMDISKQKEAERALLDQTKFTDAVLNSALVGIVVIEAETHHILSMNEKAREMIGDTDEHILGKICNQFICPAEKGNCPITDLNIEINNQQKVLLTANGERIHILKSVKKTHINGREVYVESFVDISERKKAEDELRKLSMVVKESPASIVITDREGLIEYVNPKFEEVSGYDAQQVIGKNPKLLNAHHPENTVNYKDLWDTILDGHIWKGEFCNKKKDGSIFWELSSISPVKNSQGKITHFIAIKDDISDRKEFEKKITLEKERANSANKAKGFFLAKMSHEIRTPMNGIIGMTDILLESVKDKDTEEKLKVISVSAENLLTIINEILDFSKIEAGQVELESIPVNLKELLSDVENLLSIKAQEKGLYLKARYSDQLPKCILGDPTRLKQIIINLVNNAIKFTEEGGITILLEKKKELEAPDNFILGINIIDTGIGISDEGKQKLFKAFSQTSSATTRTHGGTGLGLLISKDLAQLMGGDIGVDSESGKGSTFWVQIPTSATEPVRSIHDQNQLTESEKRTRSLHILVAEDNLINQKIAQLNLEKLGHQVRFANNGIEAVKAFKEEQFDVVFMDIQMPEMGGLEATGEIREYEIKQHIIKKTPIVALTANALKTDKEKYLAAGMNDYLSKPFKQQDLVKVLSRLHI
jgi:PAS domain S-box-containing protein